MDKHRGEWSLKPKGWYFYTNIVLGLLVFPGIFIGSFFFLYYYPDRWYWCVFLLMVSGFTLFIGIREIIVYCIRITPSEVFLPEGRLMFLLIRIKWLRVGLKDLRAMYVSGGIDYNGFYERLHFCYENGSQQVIDVLRFSDEQLCDIIDKIKENAEALNGKPVILEEDQMQKGFRRKTRDDFKS